jgi:sigma-B regulation protein RsbU (phosphoserine phosphatase)
MSIRKKLIILLLGITLIPVISIVLLNRFTLNLIGKEITSDIQVLLEENAAYTLRDIILDYEQHLRTNIQLLQTITELQASELEKALREARIKDPNRSESSFAQDEALPEIPAVEDKYFFIDETGEKNSVLVSFRRQNFFIARNADKKRSSRELSLMTGMTKQYHRFYLMSPDLFFWLHTSFESGLHLTFPSGGKLPANYDHRERAWYVHSKRSKNISVSAPYVDASTRNPVITMSKPFYYPDSSLAGITGLDIDLTDLFQWLRFNPDWASGSEAMLIARQPTDSVQDLQILARMHYQEARQAWDQALDLESLASADTAEFTAFKRDLLNGVSGIRILRYKGDKSIWAYRGFTDEQIYPLIIVPYINFKKFVAEKEDSLWAKNLDFLQYSALLVIIVIGVIIIVSVKQAESFTKPINDLAEAGIQLSKGDFAARVEIDTHNELQQLGEVFNSIGPKLREHEKMQHSLEIARAIQQRLLPKEAPHTKNFDLAGLCKYSDETGGDYFDFVSFDVIETGKISVILGDVTGHGIGAALLMASARSMLRNNIRHYACDLSRIMAEFNNELVADTDPDKFITLFYGLIDDVKKTVTWATGGHDPAIWYQAGTGKTVELKSEGVPLGFVPDMIYEQAGPVKLNSGDMIVIGTDGIWEAENKQEEMFGKERMMEVIKQNQKKSAAEICQAIVDAVISFCEPLAQADDITIVIIKVK